MKKMSQMQYPTNATSINLIEKTKAWSSFCNIIYHVFIQSYTKTICMCYYTWMHTQEYNHHVLLMMQVQTDFSHLRLKLITKRGNKKKHICGLQNHGCRSIKYVKFETWKYMISHPYRCYIGYQSPCEISVRILVPIISAI